MIRQIIILFIVLANLASCTAQNNSKITVSYKDQNIREKHHSLDIYPAQGNLRPVVVFVHGGGWLLGDKGTKMNNKVSLFQNLNYVLVSVNYRLSSFFSKKIQYPDHTNDVADAVQWIYQNIHKYGGDQNNIALLGHSAGAQMVSLLGTSEDFLPKRGIALNKIKGIISLDTEGYDVYGLGVENVNIYRRIFGDNPDVWKHASPVYQVEKNNNYPPFLIAYRGEAFRQTMAEKFASKLRSAGTEASTFSAEPYSHFEVNNKFGEKNEAVVTPKVVEFLKRIFSQK